MLVPCTNRAIRNCVIEVVNSVAAQARVKINAPTISTGRRPILVGKRPQQPLQRHAACQIEAHRSGRRADVGVEIAYDINDAGLNQVRRQIGGEIIQKSTQ